MLDCCSWRKARAHVLQWPAEGAAGGAWRSVPRHQWESPQAPRNWEEQECWARKQSWAAPSEAAGDGAPLTWPGVPRACTPSAPTACRGELLTRAISTISFVAPGSWKPRIPYISWRPHFPWRALWASEPLPCGKMKEIWRGSCRSFSFSKSSIVDQPQETATQLVVTQGRKILLHPEDGLSWGSSLSRQDIPSLKTTIHSQFQSGNEEPWRAREASLERMPFHRHPP